jgi:hypothetical protein
MKWVVLAIVGASLMVNGQEAKPRSNAHRRDSAAEAKDASTPTGQTVVLNQQTPQGQESNHPAKSPSYLHELLLPQNVPSLALVFIGIAGIIAAICTMRTINHQVEEMSRQREVMFGQMRTMQEQVTEMSVQSGILKESVGVARDAATAAKTTAEAILRSERAHVDISLVPLSQGSVVYDIRLTNYGKSHAEIMLLTITHHFLLKDAALPSQLPEGTPLERKHFNQLLPVGTPVDVVQFDMRNYFENEEISGSHTGILCVRVDYKDIFKESSFTESVYFYDQAGHMLKNMPVYNKYA